jgi:hypothetical protein
MGLDDREGVTHEHMDIVQERLTQNPLEVAGIGAGDVTEWMTAVFTESEHDPGVGSAKLAPDIDLDEHRGVPL